MTKGQLHFRDDHVGFDGTWKLRDDKVLELFCHGTSGWREWLGHLITTQIGLGEKVLLVDYMAARWVLHGARRAYPDWDAALHACEQIKILGWSLGGAHAQILTRLLQDQHIPVSCEVWGTKRVGNQKFVDKLAGTCKVVRLRGDLVPWLLWPSLRLPAWRELHGPVRWPWKAHSLHVYREMLR